MSTPRQHLSRRTTVGAVVLTAAAAATLVAGPGAFAAPAAKTPPKPTIVLVHGAWADPSSFAPVTALLQHDGYLVLNEPNPLRGLASDTAYLTSFLEQRTSGPVVLVGHSYGGAVITDAALSDPDVKALVYVDAFAPAKGESVLDLVGSVPGAPPATDLFDFVKYPAAKNDYDLYLKRPVFLQAFASGLPARQAQELGASQTPVTAGALSEPSTAPAWTTLPSWYVLGTDDQIIAPFLERRMASRAHSHITTVDSGHLSLLTHPALVTRVIEQAVARVAR